MNNSIPNSPPFSIEEINSKLLTLCRRYAKCIETDSQDDWRRFNSFLEDFLEELSFRGVERRI